MRSITHTLLVLICICSVSATARGKEPRTVEAIVAGLSSADPQVRSETLSDIYVSAHSLLPAVPALTEIALRDSQEDRGKALRILAEFGPRAAPAAKKLAVLLREPELRTRAARTILDLQPGDAAALAALRESLHAESADVREHAVDVLAGQGRTAHPALEDLLPMATDPEEDVRRAIAHAIGQICTSADDRALETLRNMLADPVPWIRETAAKALWELDEPADSLMVALYQLVQEEAAKTKGQKYQGESTGAGPGIELLATIGPEAKPALPVLIEALESTTFGQREAAIKALGSLGSEATPALEALSNSLHDTQVYSMPFVHRAWCLSDAAADALVMIGEPARDYFLDAAGEKDPRLTINVATAFGRMPASDASLAALIKLLDSRRGNVRASAAAALGKLGPNARPAAKRLAVLLNDPAAWVNFRSGMGIGTNEDLGSQVIEAYRAIDPDPASIIPSLTETLAKEGKITEAMVDVIRSLGPQAKSLVPALEPLLKKPKQRLLAAIALVKLDPNHPGLQQIFEQALADDFSVMQQHGALGLWELGSKAASSQTRLRRLFEADPSEAAIQAAALVKMSPQDPLAIKVLAEQLQFARRQFRHSDEALATWREFGQTSEPAIELLVEGLQYRSTYPDQDYFWTPRADYDVRRNSAELLLDISARTPEVIAGLIALCQTDDCSNRGDATDLLGRIGPEAHTAIPTLVQMLPDNENYGIGGDFYGSGATWHYPGEHARDALTKIGPAAIGPLSEALDSANKLIRERAAQALSGMGQSARPAEAALRRALDDRHHRVRAVAAGALGGLGQVDEPSIAALRSRLGDKHLPVRVAAATALGQLGSSAQAAKPDLQRLLANPFQVARDAAEASLARIEK